jgi:hypothetical protein
MIGIWFPILVLVIAFAILCAMICVTGSNQGSASFIFAFTPKAAWIVLGGSAFLVLLGLVGIVLSLF